MGGFMVWETLHLFWGYWLCSGFFRSLNQWSRRRCKQALEEGHSLPYSFPDLFPSHPSLSFPPGARGAPQRHQLCTPHPPAQLPPAPSQLKLFLIFPSFLWPRNLGVCRPWGWPWPMSPVTSIGRTWRAGRRTTWAGLKSPSKSMSPVSASDCLCAHPHPCFPEKRMWGSGAAGKEWDVCVSTATPSQLFRDSHENLILWGKSWGLIKPRGMERDFFLAPCPSLATWGPQHQLHLFSLLPCISSSSFFCRTFALLPSFKRRNSPCKFLFRLTA